MTKTLKRNIAIGILAFIGVFNTTKEVVRYFSKPEQKNQTSYRIRENYDSVPDPWMWGCSPLACWYLVNKYEKREKRKQQERDRKTWNMSYS